MPALLLGSPPRHLREQVDHKVTNVTKIPSLFDIKVVPPAKFNRKLRGSSPGRASR